MSRVTKASSFKVGRTDSLTLLHNKHLPARSASQSLYIEAGFLAGALIMPAIITPQVSKYLRNVTFPSSLPYTPLINRLISNKQSAISFFGVGKSGLTVPC